MSVVRALAFITAGLSLGSCDPTPRAGRELPLPSQAYVWQRMWRQEVAESIRSSRDWIERYDLLAAEVQFEKARPKVTRIEVDEAAVIQSQVPVGLVIRIFPSAARTGWDAPAIAGVTDLAESLVRDWPTGSLKELQLDFDCPESKLADFTRLLKAVKLRLDPLSVPATCTVLPSWLKHREFAELAGLVPDYVLQVHSLHLPESRRQPVALVDLAETNAAVDRAVEIGVPFRVALPTYSCAVEFDAKGRVKEVYAEDVPQTLPLQSADYIVLDADAQGMADLVSRWRREASPLMTGVIWYRLPVAGDRMNWSLAVLQKVVSGAALKRGWLVHVEPQPQGHQQVVLEQSGDVPDDLPVQVRLSWPGGAEAAADGLGGYQVRESGPGFLSLGLVNPTKMPRVVPGTRRVVGWLRMEGKPEVSASAAK